LRVFVTGAEGFIGSHVVDVLLAGSHQVTAYVLYNSFNSAGWLDRDDVASNSELQIIPGDIRDADSVQAALGGHDVVIHLASLVAIPYSYQAPRSYLETNAIGTLNVMEAARRAGVSRVVHTSTSEVYGSAQYVPIDEKHPLVGQSPYSASKIAADQISHSYGASFGLPVVTVRPFNAYGPRQSQRAFIPSVMVQLLNGAQELSLGLLTPTRDLTYVEDTAAGFVAAAMSDKGCGEVFNMGSGFEISMADVVDRIAAISGVDSRITEDSSRVRPEASEVERLLSDSSKMRETFGWEPAHGGLEGFGRGLEKTYEWFRNNYKRAGYDATKYVV
jgi:NAD dependent epimerase/dehydratase